MLVLIALILLGVGVIAVAGTVLLLRSAPTIKSRLARHSDSELTESEVYKKLYGKRSLTVSAPLPVEAPPSTLYTTARNRSSVTCGWPCGQNAQPRPECHRRRGSSATRREVGATGFDCGVGAVPLRAIPHRPGGFVSI